MSSNYSPNSPIARGETVMYNGHRCKVVTGGTGRVTIKHPVTGLKVSVSTSKLSAA